MRFVLFRLFLLLPWFVAGQELVAQSTADSLGQTTTISSSNISSPTMSEDGNWLALRKGSWDPAWNEKDLEKDTVLLFNLQKRGKEKLVAKRSNVSRLVFVGNTHLLCYNDSLTELLDLKTLKSVHYKGVRGIQALKSGKQFLLHYGASRGNKLELRVGNGELLSDLENVSRFYTTDSGRVYALAVAAGGKNQIIFMDAKKSNTVHKSSNKIEFLEIDPGEKGAMVFERDSATAAQKVCYLDFKTHTSYPLKEALAMSGQRIFTEVISEGDWYFLKVLTNKEKPKSTLVDIWHGDDNQLQKKFHAPVKVSNYTWNPRENIVQQIGDEHLTNNIQIGNERYFLSFSPYKLQDYTSERAPLELLVYDRIGNKSAVLDTIYSEFSLSGNGEYALSFGKHGRYLYHIPTGTKKAIPGAGLNNGWFTTDGNFIVFDGEGALWKYTIRNESLEKISGYEGYKASVENGTNVGISISGGNFRKREVDLKKPLLIKLVDPERNATSYVVWHNGTSRPVVSPTTKYIRSVNYNAMLTQFVYIQEDYNAPPCLIQKQLGKEEQVVYQSNTEDASILSLKQEMISYANSDGVPLKGILYYPLRYDLSRKYPMVVHIYGKQSQLGNRYPYFSYYDQQGFNIRLLLENGYFVYLPDIVIQGKKGPGVEALDCVNQALDALAHNSLIDKTRMGLIGHSFGGYETDFIATHSKRFAAYVSGSGHSDIVWAANAFNYNFLFPDYVRIEANMYKLGMPFSQNRNLYVENNPVYHAQEVNAPVLLWTGLSDKNVTSDHTMSFYNALRRNGKDVVALFYEGEGHSLQRKEAQIVLTLRIQDWFDRFLKKK
jgi:dipeptidyl aminopeptidase/acylaminoacyl peptidase